MKKVFIGGSRRLSRLNKEVAARLDKIIKNELAVLVGDANGADRTVQDYLARRGYRKVTVFCAATPCRNNVGRWPTRQVAAPADGRRDFAFYASKDRVMVDEADYGLMLWDGRSRGTLTSAVDLIRQGKPVVVYVSPSKRFETFMDVADLPRLLERVDAAMVHQLERDLQVNVSPPERRERAGNLLLF